MNYDDLFPKHNLNKFKFIDDLKKLKAARDSKKVVSYWTCLQNEGNMLNILQVFESSPASQEKIKFLMYSFAEFMKEDDFVEFKKMLGIHGHILEFVRAILNQPTPNLEIVRYFIMVAKSPRHYDPQIIQWFWEKVSPLIEHDSEMKQQFLDNCSNSIHRWIVTQKRNKKYKTQFEDPPRYVTFEKYQIPSRLIPVHKNKVPRNHRGNFKEWCRNRR